MTPSDAGERTPARSLRRNRAYMLLWSGQLVSDLGSGISAFAAPLLIPARSVSRLGQPAPAFSCKRSVGRSPCWSSPPWSWPSPSSQRSMHRCAALVAPHSSTSMMHGGKAPCHWEHPLASRHPVVALGVPASSRSRVLRYEGPAARLRDARGGVANGRRFRVDALVGLDGCLVLRR